MPPSEYDNPEVRAIHDARSVALRDITTAAEDAKRAVGREAEAVKPGRRPWTVLILVLFLISGTGVVGLVYQQVQASHQDQIARETCLLRNGNGHLAKALYESLAHDAQSPLYRADFQKAADGLQFQDCSKI